LQRENLMKTSAGLCLALFFLPCITPTRAQTPTIEQSLSMKGVSNPRISPDGRLVAYQERTTDWDQNAFVNQIWIANAATGERYQLTSGKKSSNSAAWSPDSRRLAFLSDREGKSQIYLISPSGGEAFQLTKVETGV